MKTTTKAANVRLWVAQSILAIVFLFAGVMKFVMPLDVLTQQSHMPGLFIRFIGFWEVLGALGLLLPGIFRIRTQLTGLAAAGLVVIMTGATAIGFSRGQIGAGILPLVIGLLALYVARNRWEPRTIRAHAHARAFEKAA